MIITLLGYMGCGKTHIGKLLSNKINFEFFDLDQIIEDKEGDKILNIFNSKGEIYFRKLENKYLLNFLKTTKENSVLSLGGGTPIFYNNIDIINKYSESIYLFSNPEEISERIFMQKSKRPLISHLKNQQELTDFIRKHLFERNYFYMKAKNVVKNSKKDKHDIVKEIQEIIINL